MGTNGLQRSTRLLLLTDTEREQLERWARSRTSSHRLVTRSRIVLLATNDISVAAVATRLHVARGTVRLWMRRFAQGGLAAIQRDAPGRGRRRGSLPLHALTVLKATRELIARGVRPTVRQVAAGSHVSAASVCRIWKRYGVAPRAGDLHLIEKLEQLISETAERRR